MFRRVAVIGNGGGGKTTISRKIGAYYNIPVFHVDSIQYEAGWKYTSEHECDRMLNKIADSDSWLVDGFGSKTVIERRLRMADAVVFIDLPLYQHYWWAGKRQLNSWRGSRVELPEGCHEFSLLFTVKLISAMREVNRSYVPWFRALVADLPVSTTLFHLQSPSAIHQFLADYCPLDLKGKT